MRRNSLVGTNWFERDKRARWLQTRLCHKNLSISNAQNCARNGSGGLADSGLYRICTRKARRYKYDVLTTLVFDEEGDDLKYDKVKEKFDQYFTIKRNVIYERAKFNQRKQEQDEPAETFITSLYCLAEYCNYGVLKKK